MGLLDFSTARGQAVLHYSWKFATNDGNFGILMETSLPNNWSRVGTYALERQGSMLFYLKTWSCPSHFPYFNKTTNLCQTACGPYFLEKLNNSDYYC